jgi:dTDP-4-amino-4,6-dideoxygalactose transaminase
MVGANFRLDAIQAAILRVKLPHLDHWNEARGTAARRYQELFEEASLVSDAGPVYATPQLQAPGRQVFHQYVIRADRRDELREHLQRRGVATAIYYPIALHRQECFAYLGHAEGDFPLAERATRESVALPIYPELRLDQQRIVVEAIAEFYRM